MVSAGVPFTQFHTALLCSWYVTRPSTHRYDSRWVGGGRGERCQNRFHGLDPCHGVGHRRRRETGLGAETSFSVPRNGTNATRRTDVGVAPATEAVLLHVWSLASDHEQNSPARSASESRQLVAYPDSDEPADSSQQNRPHREEPSTPQRRQVASDYGPDRERGHDDESRVPRVLPRRISSHVQHSCRMIAPSVPRETE